MNKHLPEYEICKELTDSLSGKKCDWAVYSHNSTVYMQVEPKGFEFNSTLDKIIIRFKGSGTKGMSMLIDAPITLEKQENRKLLMYTLYSANKEKCLIVGYSKDSKG
jgi:hypothetical protein